MNWLSKLQHKWQLENVKQVVMVLVVFACTGITVMLLKKPIILLLTDDEASNIWFSVLYYLFILPIYNIVLLIYGFIFGQFSFFWTFEKKVFCKIKRLIP
jgi:hypothetical protein